MCKCKYCSKEFGNERKMISHLRHCKNNPNYETNKLSEINAREKISKSLREKAKNNELNEISTYTFICEKCGKEYTLLLKKRDFLKGKYRKYCSRGCANTHLGLTKGKTKICKCIDCGKEIEVSVHSREDQCRCKDCREKRINFIRNLKTYNKLKSFDEYKNKNTNNRNKNKHSRSLEKECILTKTVCSSNCFFYLNNICKQSKSGIAQKINTLTKYCNFNIEACIDEEHAKLEYYRLKNAIQEDIDLGLSGNDVCIKYTGSSKHGNTIFNILNIKTRNLSEAVSLAFIQGKVEAYKECEHIKNDGSKVILRSTYEDDYANELDNNNILYEYEPFIIYYYDTQQKRNRYAVPDFYLPESNTIVEIKSTWTLDIQNMKDKVEYYKKEGYNFKLILNHKETDLYSL